MYSTFYCTLLVAIQQMDMVYKEQSQNLTPGMLTLKPFMSTEKLNMIPRAMPGVIYSKVSFSKI